MKGRASTLILILMLIIILASVLIGYRLLFPGFFILVTASEPGNITSGSHLYMNGVVIGTVTDIDLISAGSAGITIRLNKKYQGFLSESSVFTIENERSNPDKPCLLCKNCQEFAPEIQSGHVFAVLSPFRYRWACIGRQSSKLWQGIMKEILLQSIDMGGEFSNEGLEKLKDFESQNHDEFVKIIDELKKEMDNLTPEIEAQLDKLL